MFKVNAILSLVMMLALAGCNSYHADFACNKTYPARCAPLHEINEQIGNEAYIVTPRSPLQEGIRQLYTQLPAAKKNSNLDRQKVQIWLAGYYDSEGRYHHAHTVDVENAKQDDNDDA